MLHSNNNFKNELKFKVVPDLAVPHQYCLLNYYENVRHTLHTLKYLGNAKVIIKLM